MISKSLKIALVVLVIGASGGATGFLHLDNRQMRQRLAARQLHNQSVARLRDDNADLRNTLARTQGDESTAREAIHADVIRARAETVAWEKRAAERNEQLTAKAAAEAEALATNRDPQKGLTRLEHFQNLGRATPGAALQTLVWAALKGDDALLGQVSTIPAPARAKAEALIAGLPEDARARWTPERLAAMFFTGAFNEVTAAQVLAETPKDSTHTSQSVRLTNGDKNTTIPLQWQLGPAGWQVVVDEKFIGAVQKRVANASGPAVEKQ